MSQNQEEETRPGRFLTFDDLVLALTVLSAYIGLSLCTDLGAFFPLFSLRTEILGLEVTVVRITTSTIVSWSTVTFLYFACTRLAFLIWHELLRFRWRLRFFTAATIVQSIYLHELILAFTHWGFDATRLGVFRDLPEFYAFYTHLFATIVGGCLLIQALIIFSILSEKKR